MKRMFSSESMTSTPISIFLTTASNSFINLALFPESVTEAAHSFYTVPMVAKLFAKPRYMCVHCPVNNIAVIAQNPVEQDLPRQNPSGRFSQFYQEFKFSCRET